VANISRQDWIEERIWQAKDKIEKIFAYKHKEKSKNYYNISKLWDRIKRSNIRIHKVVEGAEIQTKGTGSLFNKIITDNFPTLCNDIDTHVQEAFRTPNRHD
jgi:hypothetical protein